MSRKYSIAIILLCICFERHHRRCFDNLYRQDHKITWYQRPAICILNLMHQIRPDYRPYLVKWKSIFRRAYRLHKLSFVNYGIYLILSKVNTARYSPYLLPE